MLNYLQSDIRKLLLDLVRKIENFNKARLVA
jgi:hypothetical protein